MEIPAGAWILIADGTRALFLRNDGEAVYPNLHVVNQAAQADPLTRDQGESAPGRLSDNGSPGQRSAVQETDWHRIAKDRFAADLAKMLHESAAAKVFDKLILVAPPQILGELRRDISEEVSSRVIGELHKDLTNHPVGEIETIITSA